MPVDPDFWLHAHSTTVSPAPGLLLVFRVSTPSTCARARRPTCLVQPLPLCPVSPVLRRVSHLPQPPLPYLSRPGALKGKALDPLIQGALPNLRRLYITDQGVGYDAVQRLIKKRGKTLQVRPWGQGSCWEAVGLGDVPCRILRSCGQGFRCTVYGYAFGRVCQVMPCCGALGAGGSLQWLFRAKQKPSALAKLYNTHACAPAGAVRRDGRR